MRWTRRNQWWRPLARRLTAGLALTSYLVAVIGFPLPAAAAKDHSRRYPCENHACGCQTAEECWRHCCCFSPEERFAWAREHHVQPPPYAEPPRAGSWRTVRLRDRAEGQAGPKACASCCGGKGPAKDPPAPARKSCCTGKKDDHSCCQADSSAKESRRSHKRALPGRPGLNPLHCQGLGSLWAGGGTVPPPPSVFVWRPCLEPAGWLSLPNAVPPVLSPTPPEPPPRSAGV